MAADLKKYLHGQPQSSTAPPRRRGRLGLLAAAAAAAILFLAGIVIYVRTDNGTVAFKVEPDDARITIVGDRIVVTSPGDEISLSVGEYEAVVTRNGFVPQTKSFRIERGQAKELPLELKKGTVLPVKPGWTSLDVSRWIETDPDVSGICLSKDGATFYAAYWANKIQQFDVPSGMVSKTISFDDQDTHGGAALSADERFLYTTNYFKQYVSRFDLKRDYERTNLPISELEHPWVRRNRHYARSKEISGRRRDGWTIRRFA